MRSASRNGFVRHVLKKNYSNTIPDEHIIAEIKAYNEKINVDNYNIVYLFDEYCLNIDRRVDLSFIDPNEISGNHSHDFYELIYVYRGKIIQCIKDVSFVMEGGDLLILHPTVIHSFYSYPDTSAVNILVKKDYLERFLSNINIRIKNCFLNSIADEKNFIVFSEKQDSKVLSPIIEKMCEVSELSDIAKERLEVKNFGGNKMVDVFLTEQFLQQIILTIIKGLDENFILEKFRYFENVYSDTEEIIKYLRENYKDITIEKLSKKFGYSTAQIYRIIKQRTGTNLNLIVKITRIQRAKYLLRNTNYAINEIAKMVGIDSYEYFSRMFKKHVNCSPKEYRKMTK